MIIIVIEDKQAEHSKPMHGAGYFPDHTLTEDYALGMEMRRTGWREVYVEDELVRGSAPDKVRGAFGQRSRWCKVLPTSLLNTFIGARVGARHRSLGAHQAC